MAYLLTLHHSMCHVISLVSDNNINSDFTCKQVYYHLLSGDQQTLS